MTLRMLTIIPNPLVKSDVPPFVRFHAPAIRAHLKRWNEDIEAEDFLRGADPTQRTSGHLFQCIKFPNVSGFVSDAEIANARNDHQFLLVYRGWSDLFTNIHADVVRTEVLSDISKMFRDAWKERFPDARRSVPIPDRVAVPGTGFEYREDYCHHCDDYTQHSNSEHDPWTFHCTREHAARPRFEN